MCVASPLCSCPNGSPTSYVMKIILSVALTLTLVACSAVPRIQPSRPIATITEAGLYVIGGEAPIPMPEGPSGQSRLTSTAQLVSTTTEVPLKLNTRFGFCFTISGISPDGPAELTKVVSHPPIRRADGTIKSSYTARRPIQVVNGRVSACEGYGFDHDYELVPGVWKFALLYDGQELVTQQFTAH